MPSSRSFFGRREELKLLSTLWDADQASLLVLFGRRRVGKTRLLTHWVSQSHHRALYWVAAPTTSHEQLLSFSQALYNLENPNNPAPATFTYATWEQAWVQAAALAREDRLALLVDEFTYLLESDPGLAGVLQNAWDRHLKGSNLFLVLAGSRLGMMQRQLLSYQAPLYGRATAQLHLHPLPFGVTKSYFPHYTPAERVAIYAIFGGIPAYWERIDQRMTVPENIQRQLLTPNNLMQEEPRLLLQDFVREPHNYVALLHATTQGARTQKEISTFTGLPQGHVSKYLSVLQEAGYVERRVPVTGSPGSRLGRYHVTDPYLRFYFRFLAGRQAQLALGATERALDEIKRHLLDFIGTHTWQELCREWVLWAGDRGELPFSPDQVGSAWTSQVQVDVVGINGREKSLCLGECKWSPARAERKVLTDLIAKTAEIVPRQGRWQVYYLGFARGGWTPAATDFARELVHGAGDHWQVAGIQLLDLDRVDADLARWTGSG